MIEPLRIRFTVDCPRDHAFAVWTDQFGRWWPAGHSVSGAPQAIILEPRVGGRIYERTAVGDEIDWGEIIEWVPPDRLVYWWHIRRDRTDATHVAISFTTTGSSSTLVEIVHSGWEVLGAAGEEWRDANRSGWSGLLPHYLDATRPTHDRSTT